MSQSPLDQTSQSVTTPSRRSPMSKKKQQTAQASLTRVFETSKDTAMSKTGPHPRRKATAAAKTPTATVNPKKEGRLTRAEKQRASGRSIFMGAGQSTLATEEGRLGLKARAERKLPLTIDATIIAERVHDEVAPNTVQTYTAGARGIVVIDKVLHADLADGKHHLVKEYGRFQRALEAEGGVLELSMPYPPPWETSPRLAMVSLVSGLPCDRVEAALVRIKNRTFRVAHGTTRDATEQLAVSQLSSGR